MSKAASDAWITSNLPGMETAQADAMTTGGRYHQCLESHTVIPDATRKPDLQAAKTSDNDEGWSNFTGAILSPDLAMPCSVAITVYRIGAGQGWTLRVKTKDTNVNYLRTISYGPEAEERSTPWTVITEPAPEQLPAAAPARAKK